MNSETTGTSSTYYRRDNDGKLVSERLPSGAVYYYGFDALGSTAVLADTAGTKQQSYAYEPYGAVTLTPSSGGPANPWRYAGSYQDPTGFYKMGMRYYANGLMRWTQQDSKEAPTDVHGITRYAYVGGDPINESDPTGQQALTSVPNGRWGRRPATTAACTPRSTAGPGRSLTLDPRTGKKRRAWWSGSA